MFTNAFLLIVFASFLFVGTVRSFQASLPRKCYYHREETSFVCLDSKKNSDGDDRSSAPKRTPPSSFGVGTYVEFEESKKHRDRVNVGTIMRVEFKSNGDARYDVTDGEGKKFQIADKAIHFGMIPPNSPGPAKKLFDEFCKAQKATDDELQAAVDISPELLELAWENAVEEDADDDDSSIIATTTPESLIELCHSHTASAIEKYQAWRLLQSDISHVFFKDMKDHGRISSFKAKARKAVEKAKGSFCMDANNAHNGLCLV
jgi:hypothetical protein